MEELDLSHSEVTFNGADVSYNPQEDDDTTMIKTMETSTRHKEPVDLEWKDLSFSVPLKKTRGQKKGESRKQILNSMSGSAPAGSMIAVMGSSGAGKTSLLNLLAGRITSTKGARATGSVMINGKPRDYSTFRKISAYVLQDDDMFGELTVQEQLTYAALLRLPASMPKEKKLLRVEKVMQELGLQKVKNSMIGNQIVRGISGGERKRVNIGTELVTDPALLFLDEPTTGLDSFNALNVMTTLRHLASNGRTVVSTIHQPRSSIFALFDQLCLLSEGRVMYFGAAKDAVSYFSALNFRSPAQFNPADFFLDLLSIDPRSPEREARTKARVEFLGDRYMAQEQPVMIEGPRQVDVEAGGDESDSREVVFSKETYQTSWMNEFSVLCDRAIKLVVREKVANGARLGQIILFSILLGLIWLNNGRETDDRQKRMSLTGVLFFMIINQSFVGVFSVIFTFPLERSVVTRERAANTYRTSSYYLSKTITDLPKTLFFNILFSSIVYWMIGFKQTAGAFFIFIAIIFVTTFLAESLAITISILTGDAQTAAGIIPLFIILAVLFGGFFIGSNVLDDWISWAKYLSFVFYAFNALAKNEFTDRPFEDEILKGFNSLSIGENIACLIAMLIFLRIVGYLCLQFLRGPKFLKF